MIELFYLTTADVQHYSYMLQHGYSHKVVGTPSQDYVVFGVIDKPKVGIAWPTLSGSIDRIPTNDVIFQLYAPLQDIIAPYIVGSTIKFLLFPNVN
jgi:hypothetical protein